MKVRSLIVQSILIYTQLSDFALCKKLSEYNSCAEITAEKENLNKEDFTTNGNFNETAFNDAEEALKKTYRLCSNKQDIRQTMGVFLSVLGIICLVGLCCLCLAPNSTRLNSKKMWMEIN